MSIEVSGIVKRFGPYTAVDEVSLTIPDGSLVALLGPSGSGKTTLLRIIAGLESVDAGRVYLNGADVTDVQARRRGVGFVFQHYALFRHMTVQENVGFSLKVRGRPRAEIDATVEELLRLVRLQGFGGRYPSQLSGGQRQRVALARALAARPSVLLLDEPFGALDANVRQELRKWLRQLHDELGVTSVFVTHDQEEALEVADRVVVMNHGRVEQEGTRAHGDFLAADVDDRCGLGREPRAACVPASSRRPGRRDRVRCGGDPGRFLGRRALAAFRRRNTSCFEMPHCA